MAEHPKRRRTDNEDCGNDDCICVHGDCITIKELSDRVETLETEIVPLMRQALAELQELKAQSKTQLEIITVWNNTKGFVRTISMLGTVAKWIAGVAAAVVAIWMFITHGYKG